MCVLALGTMFESQTLVSLLDVGLSSCWFPTTILQIEVFYNPLSLFVLVGVLVLFRTSALSVGQITRDQSCWHIATDLSSSDSVTFPSFK